MLTGTNENAPRNGSRVVVVTVPARMDRGARTVAGAVDVAADVVADVVVVVVEGAVTIVPTDAFGAAALVGTGVTSTLEAGATVAETGATTVGPDGAGTGAAADNGATVGVEGTGAVDCGEADATDGVVTSGPEEVRRGERCRAPSWRDAPSLSDARAASRLGLP